MKPEERRVVRTYTLVWMTLLILLGLTVASAYLKLGSFNLIASLVISIVKTGLVMALFMELRRESGTVAVFAIAGFFWLALMIGPTVMDIATR
jgi:cytochrome c oxidase subunit IV